MSNRNFRHGIYLLDVCVGAVLVSVAMLILLQVAFQLSEHRNDMKIRQKALDTLANVDEMLDLRNNDWAEQNKTLEEMVARSLPDGRLQIENVAENTEAKTALKEIPLVRITVSYDDGANKPRREYSLLRVKPQPLNE